MSASRVSRWTMALLLLAGTAQAQTVVKYVHTDALGSVVALTDTARTVLERREYEPYGLQLPAMQAGPGYTGHVQDAGTGLIYMQARYYDPFLGRFLSVDPVTATSIGGNFNRYWYANNNPYGFVDPDGRQAKESEANTCSRVGAESCSGAYNNPGGNAGINTAPPIRDGGDNSHRAAGPGSVFESRNQAEGEADAYVDELNGGPIRSLFGGQMYLTTIIELDSPNAFTYILTPVQTGMPPAVGIGSARNVIFGAATHSFLRLEQAGLSSARVASVVSREAVRIRDVMAVGADVRGRMLINGVLIEYRMFKLPNGTINVGTIFPVR